MARKLVHDWRHKDGYHLGITDDGRLVIEGADALGQGYWRPMDDEEVSDLAPALLAELRRVVEGRKEGEGDAG